jgi:hypothetical protein
MMILTEGTRIDKLEVVACCLPPLNEGTHWSVYRAPWICWMTMSQHSKLNEPSVVWWMRSKKLTLAAKQHKAYNLLSQRSQPRLTVSAVTTAGICPSIDRLASGSAHQQSDASRIRTHGTGRRRSHTDPTACCNSTCPPAEKDRDETDLTGRWSNHTFACCISCGG